MRIFCQIDCVVAYVRAVFVMRLFPLYCLFTSMHHLKVRTRYSINPFYIHCASNEILHRARAPKMDVLGEKKCIFDIFLHFAKIL